MGLFFRRSFYEYIDNKTQMEESMKKIIISALIAGIMAVGAMTGCNNGNTSQQTMGGNTGGGDTSASGGYAA